MKLAAALAILLSTADYANAFQTARPQTLRTIHSRTGAELVRAVASASSNPEFSSPGDALGDAVNSVTNEARDYLVQAVSDEPDEEEIELSVRKSLVKERTKTFKVTLPLTKRQQLADTDSVLSMGVTLCQIGKGRVVGDSEMNLDTMEVQEMTDDETVGNAKIDRADKTLLSKRVDRDFQGLVVSSVVKGSAAWVGGVRAGDIVKGTSATLGDAIWPKSTLDGVRSAVSSRKAVSGSIQFEFQRVSEEVDNQFELSLPRPIGLELAGKSKIVFQVPSDPRGFLFEVFADMSVSVIQFVYQKPKTVTWKSPVSHQMPQLLFNMQ